MTPSELDEINKQVARKLGWWNFDIGIGGTPEDTILNRWDGKLVGSRPPRKVNADLEPVPDYSRSIEAAWEIVDHVGFDKFEMIKARLIPKWSAVFKFQPNYPENKKVIEYYACEDTPALAICLAFLKLP